MADIIERGFSEILKKIDMMKKEEASRSEEIRKKDAELLQKMGDSVRGVISGIGMNMLERGKQDAKGELYNPVYYPKKMIILARQTPSRTARII